MVHKWQKAGISSEIKFTVCETWRHESKTNFVKIIIIIIIIIIISHPAPHIV